MNITQLFASTPTPEDLERESRALRAAREAASAAWARDRERAAAAPPYQFKPANERLYAPHCVGGGLCSICDEITYVFNAQPGAGPWNEEAVAATGDMPPCKDGDTRLLRLCREHITQVFPFSDASLDREQARTIKQDRASAVWKAFVAEMTRLGFRMVIYCDSRKMPPKIVSGWRHDALKLWVDGVLDGEAELHLAAQIAEARRLVAKASR